MATETLCWIKGCSSYDKTYRIVRETPKYWISDDGSSHHKNQEWIVYSNTQHQENLRLAAEQLELNQRANTVYRVAAQWVTAWDQLLNQADLEPTFGARQVATKDLVEELEKRMQELLKCTELP